jgi:NAD(P)H dehydrogenase (quinone)
MPKVLVVYESKYGNTKRVAEAIIEEMKEIPGLEASLLGRKDVNRKELPNYDAILIGSPNHMGNATHGILGFIGKVGKLKLEGKLVAVFDTYRGVYDRAKTPQFQVAMKKMENHLVEKAPTMKLVTPGLSIMVQGKEGPITEGELPKAKEFGAKFAVPLVGKARFQGLYSAGTEESAI